MTGKEMLYKDVPYGGEWRHPKSPEGSLYKLADDNSITERGTILGVHPKEKVVLIGISRRVVR